MPTRDGSRGAEIVEFVREHGLDLFEWQAQTTDDFSGTFEEGWASRANVLVVPRQNGKSEILIGRALFGLFVLRKRLILVSSHQWASSNELFLRMKGIIESSPALEAQVEHTRLSAAQLGFELTSGERILFLTRSRAAARGFSADEIYFDEAHFLSEAAHASLSPAAAARSAKGSVQMFYACSAVDQARHPDGLVITRLRQKALEGEEGIALVEFSAGLVDDEGRDLLPAAIPAGMAVDPEVLERANPGCPLLISHEFLLDRARQLDGPSFWTEHGGMGDWPDLDATAGGVVDVDKWAGLRDPDSKPVGPVKVSFDVSPERRWGSVAVVGKRGDEKLHVEVVDNAPGTGWIVPRIAQLVADHDVAGIVCDAAQNTLADQVSAATGMRCEQIDRGELVQACAGFIDLVEDGELRHLGDPLLLDAIKGAQIGRAGGDGWVFSRRSSRIDISPLYAAVLGLHAGKSLSGEDELWADWLSTPDRSANIR